MISFPVQGMKIRLGDKVGYTLEQSQPVSLALYKMAEGDEWTGDEVELVPGDTTDPEPFLADFVGYLYGTRVLDNIDNPDEEAEEVTGHQLSREDWMYIISETATGMRPQKAIIGDYAYGFAGKKFPLEMTPKAVSSISTPPTSAPLILPMILKTAATPVPGAMAIIYPSCMTSLAASLNPPMRMVRKNLATTS